MGAESVLVDNPKCRGHGVCVLLAPDFFAVEEDGIAAVLRQPVDHADEAVVDDAIDNCPARAIRWAAPAGG